MSELDDTLQIASRNAFHLEARRGSLANARIYPETLPDRDQCRAFLRYRRLRFDEAVLRKTARSMRVLFGDLASKLDLGFLDECYVPSDDMEAPDNRNSLSPI
jgi:hypothetical protein